MSSIKEKMKNLKKKKFAETRISDQDREYYKSAASDRKTRILSAMKEIGAEQKLRSAAKDATSAMKSAGKRMMKKKREEIKSAASSSKSSFKSPAKKTKMKIKSGSKY